MVEERPATVYTKVTALPEHFITVRSTWYTISGRVVNFNKKLATTDLWVYYDDTLGLNAVTANVDAGDFRLVMDATAFRVARMYVNPYVTSGQYFMWPFSLMWLVPGITAGAHTTYMQMLMYTGASYMYTGFNNGDTQNSLVVEERPRGSMAFASNFGLASTSSTGFVTLNPSRTVTHTKLSATTLIRVTIMDTLGFFIANAFSTAQGCHYRILMDGSTQFGSIYYTTSTTTAYGWRIYPMKLVWYGVVPAGSHSYVLQWYTFYSANQCNAGYPTGNTANYMIVEEIEDMSA